jgi:hypothetical protein
VNEDPEELECFRLFSRVRSSGFQTVTRDAVQVLLGRQEVIDLRMAPATLTESVNHANYGSYTTNASNAAFGQPAFNANIAYQPRELQLGFRLAF